MTIINIKKIEKEEARRGKWDPLNGEMEYGSKLIYKVGLVDEYV